MRIRIYKNRKCYDVDNARYVNHAEIATRMAYGETLAAEYKGGEDATAALLASIVGNAGVDALSPLAGVLATIVTAIGMGRNTVQEGK